MSSTSVGRWALALLLLAGAGGGVRWAMRPKPIPVRVVRAVVGQAEEVVTSTKAGAVRSRLVADVSLEAAGTIVALHAREGAAVKKGQPLVSIDARDEEAALESAEKEQAVLEALAVEAAARQHDAERERTRLEALRRTGAATTAEMDRAATQVEVAAAALAGVMARAAAQRAVVHRAQIALEHCTVRAPFDGVVAERWVEQGEWALPGQRALRLLDPSQLYVRAEIDEVDLGRLRPGLLVRVRLDPWKDRVLPGRITRVAPYVSEVQEQNRTLEVEAELDPGAEDVMLKPGTSADVEVILEAHERALLVPTLALLEGDKVLVVGEGGVLRAVPLKIGLRSWERVEVLSGLAAGDGVVVSLEAEAVKAGAAVTILDEGAAP